MYDVENPVDVAMDPVDQEAAQQANAQAQVERLQLFNALLVKRRKEAVTARAVSGVERRWLDDIDSYDGRDAATRRVDIMEAVRGEQIAQRRTSGDSQASARSTVFVQLTRQKTNTAAARAADMLYPTDDKNWGIKPTPVPELMDAAKNGSNEPYIDPGSGQPLQHPQSGTDPDNPARNVTMADLATEQMAVAQTKSEAMEKEIDDQLTECQYNYEGRKVIEDAAKYGTGILKGPSVINRVEKKWVQKTGPDGSTVQVLQVIQEMKPRSYQVDVWNFYPDPSCGENIQNGAYVFERDYQPGRELAKLAKVAGYNAMAIAMCLQDGPQHTLAEGSYSDQQRGGDLAYNRDGAYDDKRFEIWTYTGDAAREDLEAAGVNIPDDLESYLVTYSAVIVMCNDRIIKALLNPMDTGDFPYDVYNWERVAMSPFGVGVPYLMRYAQRTLNAAWRAMLDNMALSSGPQIIMNRKLVTPADGNWQLTARKLWFMEDGDDVQKAFFIFEVPSHQQEISNIITIAQQFADVETSLPQIAQGEKGSAPDSVGGMAMLMNSAGTVLRRLVKQYDDQITRPHLRRYYDWNMQYNPKEEIKGDFEVDARGSSVLIVRDQAQQGVMNLLQVSKDPEFSVFIDKQKLFTKSLEMQHITPDDVMNTPEQIMALQKQAQQAPPADPRIQAAQLTTASNEKIAAARAQAEVQYAQAEQEIARDDHAAQMAMLEVKREIAIMQYATQEKMQLTAVKSELAQLAMKLSSDHSLANATRMTTAAQNSGPPSAATPQLSPDAELQS